MKLLKTAYSFDDVLLVPGFSQVNSRKDIDLSTSISGLKLDIPIISANMSSVTGAEMCIALGKLGGLGILHRMMSIDEMVTAIKSSLSAGARKVGFSFGIGDDWMDRFVAGIEAGASIACLDVAHAHHIRVRKIIETISTQKYYYAFPLIVGNVATADAAIDIRYWYIQNNLHYAKYGELLNPITIKVGIGGGSLCTTRVMTGCGIPTLQSVMDVQYAAYDTMDIIADGGIRNSGDIVKSIAAGASAVMLGSIFAGTKEAPGDVILGPDGKKYKVYRGSASFGDKKTRGEETKNIEGTETLVEYKGSINDIIPDLLDGIRSGFSYLGNELNTNYIKFVHITNNGLNESKPHGVKYV